MSAPNPTLVSSDNAISRARLSDPENFFAFSLPSVPRRQFVTERDAAFADDRETGEVLLDSSDQLGTSYAATTPLLLARYLRIRAGESLSFTRKASAEINYVMRGAGTTKSLGERVDWAAGDVMCFPGGVVTSYQASEDSVLFLVCNEPLLALEQLEPPREGHGRVGPVHWQHDAIEQHLDRVYQRENSSETAGNAVQLVSTAMAPTPLPVPSMNLAMNTLEPGCDQRPHRHNGVAITLSIHGEGVHSMIEDERVDWVDGAAQITPATQLHSHHNRGQRRMRSLVIQDEGLHFYARTPGFSWD